MSQTKRTKKFLEGGYSGKGKFPRGTKKYRQCEDEDGPLCPPVGMKRQHQFANKDCDWGSVGTNFKYLKRFLRSRVGQNWDDVYSEICASADARSFEGNHLREWLDFAVDVKTHMEGEKIVDHHGCDVTVSFHRDNFYVNPLTNKLEVATPRKRKHWRESIPKTVFELDGIHYHEHEGIWYRVQMQEAPKVRNRWGYLTYASSYPDQFLSFGYEHNYWSIERKLRDKYGYSPEGKVWYCIHKESANSKEIARLKKSLQQKNAA